MKTEHNIENAIGSQPRVLTTFDASVPALGGLAVMFAGLVSLALLKTLRPRRPLASRGQW